MEKIKEFLLKNDYFIKVVYNRKPFGVIGYFPERVIPPVSKPFEVHCHINYKKSQVTLEVMQNGDIIKKEVIDLPQYALRLCLSTFIIRTTQDMLYQPNCILFEIDGNLVNELVIDEALTDPNQMAEDAMKECYLMQLIMNAYSQGFPIEAEELARTNFVLEGYTILKSILQGTYNDG